MAFINIKVKWLSLFKTNRVLKIVWLINFVFIFLLSCEQKPLLVMFQPPDLPLYGLSRDAVKGSLDLSGEKKLEYRFEGAAGFTIPVSLEIAYSVTGEGRPVLETGGYSWKLPAGNDFGDNTRDSIFHYAVPVSAGVPEYFCIAPSAENRGGKESYSRMEIFSIKLVERRYGFYRLQDTSGNRIYAAPFVSMQPDAWVINLPDAFIVPAGFFPQLSVTMTAPLSLPPTAHQQEWRTAASAGKRRFDVSPRLQQLVIPPGMITHNEKPLVLPVHSAAAFHVGYTKAVPFPAPLAADPGMVLAWPRDAWRSSRYEVFRWEYFPSLLIFDTADYEVQDNLFKRLAFFVEKAGFRGRLAPDAEIAKLHGWNAHDYRAEDLAGFFQTARKVHFPLRAEERELERILLDAGIIRETGAEIQGGEGGVISISRESSNSLRAIFMAHEGFHGLFFIDEDFRAFSRGRWRQLPAEAKRFLISYFGFQQYDIADEYLLINEFMAHVLQQPVSQAGYYFGQSLPSRIEESWRQRHLPVKDEASNSWPSLAEAFTREAQAFSAYVYDRWGLAAGRIHLVTVRQP